MQQFWTFVTDCGDSAITVPLALLTLVFLAAARERRLALAWLLAIGGGAMAIAVLKLGFGACGTRAGALGIVSPSGHTAMSTAVYGSLALIAGPALAPAMRRTVYLGAALLIGGIAVSRVVLHRHDTAEVALGLAVGLAAVAGFRALARRQPVRALPVVWLALGAIGVVVAMHGTRWMVEPAVHRAAGLFRLALPWCR